MSYNLFLPLTIAPLEAPRQLRVGRCDYFVHFLRFLLEQQLGQVNPKAD